MTIPVSVIPKTDSGHRLAPFGVDHAPLRASFAAHTSVSAVKEFAIGPKKFTLHYIEKAQPAYRASALVLGTAWHETIGQWLKGATNVDELQAHLRDGIDTGLRSNTAPVLFDDEGEDQGTMTDSAVRMLDVFLAKVPKPELTVGVELAFSLELAHPVRDEAAEAVGDLNPLGRATPDDGVNVIRLSCRLKAIPEGAVPAPW